MANVTINMSEDELKELLESKGIEYDTISESSGMTLYKECLESSIEMFEMNRKYKALFRNKRDETIKNRIEKLYYEPYIECEEPYIDIMDDSEGVVENLLPEE